MSYLQEHRGPGAAYIVYGTAGKVYKNVDLSSFDISQGFKISISSDDQLGFAVGYAGDVNSDGIDDFLVGAPATNSLGRYFAGAVYVIYGKSGKFSANINLGASFDISQGFKVIGSSQHNQLGSSVSYAGDVNGDGIDDIILGAYTSAQFCGSCPGTAHVIYGKLGGFSAQIDLSTLQISAGFSITGTTFSRLGSSVGNAGDFNYDGVDDVVVGAPYAQPLKNYDVVTEGSFVVYGKKGGVPSNIDLNTKLSGSQGFEVYGASVSKLAGDLNHDGIDDIVFGGHNALPLGRSLAGAVSVLYGQTGGILDTVYLPNGLDTSQGFQVIGAKNSQLGYSVSYTGDINGDKLDDLVIGAFGGPSSANGVVYLLYSGKVLFLCTLLTINTGSNYSSFSGAYNRSEYDDSNYNDGANDHTGDFAGFFLFK